MLDDRSNDVQKREPTMTSKPKLMLSAGKRFPNFCTQCGWAFREIDKFCGGCANPRR